MPKDMRALAGLYHVGYDRRIYRIVDHLISSNLLEGANRRGYVHDLSEVRTLAPIRPRKILNAAGNYYGHVGESGTPEEQRKEAEERRKNRGLPYLFLKPPSSVIANGEDIVIPRGRDKIDWECEIGVVIGQPAKNVPASEAKNHIFGYTIELDMSDRGGRGEDPPRFGGSDWLIGKGHDTFAPLGPFITPKEFMKDPMNTRHVFTLNETVMQDSNTSRMSHNIHELLHYASNILSLQPGDIIAGGSPAGTNIERAEPRWMRAGDTAKCEIDGIGAQVHPVVAESASSSDQK
jgi:2-keto-4-pentenoate hydratase/2-oxohepta-3-ene-1,7-dioic acid hydratase in catechol pathway